MNLETFKKAVALSEKVGQVFVATADVQGLPHGAAAEKITLSSQGRVIVREWFCPGTVANLQFNHQIAHVIWDASSDTGYQLLGQSEKAEDLAMLNGCVPGKEDKTPFPQVERQMIIRVDKIIDFRHAPHSDLEK